MKKEGIALRNAQMVRVTILTLVLKVGVDLFFWITTRKANPLLLNIPWSVEILAVFFPAIWIHLFYYWEIRHKKDEALFALLGAAASVVFAPMLGLHGVILLSSFIMVVLHTEKILKAIWAPFKPFSKILLDWVLVPIGGMIGYLLRLIFVPFGRWLIAQDVAKKIPKTKKVNQKKK